MSEVSISVKNVSKCYKIYKNHNDRLKEWLLPFMGKCHEEKWVLNNINLDVYKGEAVGLVGMNGAGKSTLLKIITGTVVPTTGNISFSGSVSALLELGLGFHADFTGRQNVFMSGQLLGYSAAEIEQCMEQIEDFAEIGAAIDEPVRTYSSGMQVRLAFSVATMKRPDILIVDEALSVGDNYFQHKSFNRIKEFQKEGTTLLLVSHDKAAIQAVCDKVILLDHGERIKEGRPEEIMDYYNALIGRRDEGEIEQQKRADGRVKTISGTKEITIEKIELMNEAKENTDVYKVGETCVLKVSCAAKRKIPELVCGFEIKDRLGQILFGTNTYFQECKIREVNEGEILDISFVFQMNVGAGSYSVTVALTGPGSHTECNYEWIDLAKVFQVVNTTDKYFIGCNYIPVKAKYRYLKDNKVTY